MIFLATTNIGCFLGEAAREINRSYRDDLRGLEIVEEAESKGRDSRKGNLWTPRYRPAGNEHRGHSPKALVQTGVLGKKEDQNNTKIIKGADRAPRNYRSEESVHAT